MNETETTRGQHAAADRLAQVLARQSARIRRRFLVHGLGWLVATSLAGILIYYAVDRWLELPAAVRWLLTGGLVVLVGYALRRWVLVPLRRPLGRDDVAVVIERQFPELAERFISAVQLSDSVAAGPGGLRNQSPAMIEKVIEDAAGQIAELPHDRILDPSNTVRTWAVTGGLVAVLLGAAFANPTAFSVFTSRALGSDRSYPRLTTLIVELPQGSSSYRFERQGRQVQVTMAAGDDLPILVRAEGVVPREVALSVSGGRGMAPEVQMTARGGDRFRHVFRKVSAGFSFYAHGGDDRRGNLDIAVVTVAPPRVSSIRATLAYPAYTGRAPVTLAGGGIEALAGSEVKLEVATTAAVDAATLEFLESGAMLPLERQLVGDDDGEREILVGAFVVERSDRYQVRLTSTDGLRNPHPGTYPIVALPDQPPRGRILRPADDALSICLASAVLPLRVLGRDDHGLVEAQVRVRVGRAEESGTVTLLRAEPGSADDQVPVQLLSVAELPEGAGRASVGDTLGISGELTDNRAPEPQTTELPSRQVHIVSEADLARRVSGHFRRIREAVEQLVVDQTGLQGRLEESAEALASGEAPRALRNELTVVQVGQTRLQSVAGRQHVDLMRAFDLHLFNRLDDSPNAARVLELFVAYHQEHPEPRDFLAGFYEQIGAARRDGRLGPMSKSLDPILAMILRCGAVAAELAPAAIRQLDEANVAADAAGLDAAIDRALETQRAIGRELALLQEQLAEWNEFQDVIIQARSVLEKQREVQVRTKDLLSEPAEPAPEGSKSRR
ncbi:MAG: hypothetical protein AAF628_28725 [Planctomycetota bacterium]